MIPYHIRSFLGGQSDFEDKGTPGSFKASQGLDIRKIRDSLSCQQQLTDDLAIGTMTDLALFIVPASDGNSYFFTRSGQIFRRNSSGSYLLVYTDSNESGYITGAGETYDNSGNTYILWSTRTRLNIKRIIGTGYTNTEPWNDVNSTGGGWPKTDLVSADWHVQKFLNGDYYICNDNYLNRVTYENLAYSSQALILISGNVAKTMLERGIYQITGTNRKDTREEASLYAWDGVSENYNNKQIFKVRDINSMIDTEYYLMQVGTQGQIYNSDMNYPMPIMRMIGGGQTYPDGVDASQGMALFGIFGNTVGFNGIWTFGRLKKNMPPVLNFEYALTCDEIGSVKKVGSDILVSYRTGSQYGVKKVDTTTKANAIYQSLDLIAPVGTRRYPIPLGRMLGWNRIDLQCAPIPTGCAIEAWYREDKILNNSLNPNATSDGWIQANLTDNQGLQATAGFQNPVFMLGSKARVIEVMLKLFPSGNLTPEVFEINLYFDAG